MDSSSRDLAWVSLLYLFISNVEYFDNDMSAVTALVCTLSLCMDEQDYREVSTKHERTVGAVVKWNWAQFLGR